MDKIREVVADFIAQRRYNCTLKDLRGKSGEIFVYKETDDLLKLLDSLGVILKVEEELPENPYTGFNDDYEYRMGYLKAQQNMVNYCRYERLI